MENLFVLIYIHRIQPTQKLKIMEMGIFSEYELSDNELKVLIIESVIELILSSPKAFINNPGKVLNPNLPTEQFISDTLIYFPELKQFGVEDTELSPSERLKLVAINLNTFLNNQKLRQVMLDTWRIALSSQLLSVRYGIATLFIEKVLNEKTNGNPEIIVEKLSKFITDGVDSDLFQTIKVAEKEIARVSNSQKASAPFNKIIPKQIEQMGLYFDTNINNRFTEMLQRLVLESLDKTIPEFFADLKIPDEKVNMVSKEIKSAISDNLKQSIKDNFRDLRGGKRKREVFDWTDEKLIKFYQTVKELPKIKNKSAWNFALKYLIEMEFDYETIRWLKCRPALANVPQSLFDEAVKRWRRYDEVSDINDEDKPRFFEFRHALFLLNYPDKYTYLTLRTKYFKGQNLSNKG